MEIELFVQSAADGAVQTVRCPLDRRVVIGRDLESPVQVQGPGISREHVAIEEQAGVIFISDLSSNGTSVNGSRLQKGQPREIHDGDLIEIPGYQIDLKVIAELVPEPDVPIEVAEEPVAEVPPPPKGKLDFLKPALHILGALTFLEKVMIACAIASFWLGAYYYGG